MGAAQQMLLGHAPPAAGGSLEWVAAGAVYDQINSQITHVVNVPAGGQVGDMLTLAMWPFGTISAVQTNTGQNLSLLADYASAGEVGRVYGVVISGSVPTTVTVTLSAANDFVAQPHLARGVTQVNGIVNDGNSIEARANLTYSSGAANALIHTFYTTTGSNTREITAATYTGGASETFRTLWAFNTRRTIVGVHNGATGINNIAVTWTEADTSGGRWMSIALVP